MNTKISDEDEALARYFCCRSHPRAAIWCALDYLLRCKSNWVCDRHDRAIRGWADE
jgi:hypothetical protein